MAYRIYFVLTTPICVYTLEMYVVPGDLFTMSPKPFKNIKGHLIRFNKPRYTSPTRV